jgi:hypothetical protein
MTFPSLGQAHADGSRGMFIADTHNDSRHIRALTKALPKLGPMIKVLFVEAFYHNQDPDNMTVPQIARHLADRAFNWTPSLAQDLLILVLQAARYGIEIKGVDSPLSAIWAPQMPINVRRATWRSSQMLNTKWAFKVQQTMLAFADKRFAVFGGREHGRLLMNCGLGNLICFEFDGQRFAQFAP